MVSEKEFRKLLERVKDLERENEELRDKLIGVNKNESRRLERDMSRREFLKKAGMGAAGLSALSLVPASSKLRLTNEGVFKDGNRGFLGIGDSNYLNSDIDLNGNSITDSSRGFIDFSSKNIQNIGDIKAQKASVGGKNIGRSSQVIVAADNSTDKQFADYICDGVDDHEEIQQAIDEVNDKGELFLMDGDYYLGKRLYISPNTWTRIRGASRYGTRLYVQDNFESNHLFYINDNHRTLSIKSIGIFGDGNKPNTNGDAIDGVRVTTNTQLLMGNCGVWNFSGMGINGYLNASGSFGIYRSNFNGNSRHGVKLKKAYKNNTGDGHRRLHKFVVGCNFYSNGQETDSNGNPLYDNFQLDEDTTWGTRFARITGNFMRGGGDTRYGVTIAGRGDGDNIVANNVIKYHNNGAINNLNSGNMVANNVT